MSPDKIQTIKTARKWLTEKPIFLDTETTGLGLSAEIVDLALIDSNGKTLINTLIKPTVPITCEASKVHHIKDSDVLDAPSFPNILKMLTKLCIHRRVLIYNASFDMRVLLQSAKAHNRGLPLIGPNCVMKAYAQFYGDWNNSRSSYKWQTQTNAAKQLGLELPTDLHRAAADAMLCRSIVTAMAATKLPGEEG